MRRIVPLFLLLTGCFPFQNRFVCRGGDEPRPVVLSYGEAGIMLNDFYEYWVHRSKPHPLSPKYPGGSYRLSISEEKIVLQYIQDVVRVAYKDTTGTIVEDIHPIKNREQLTRIRRYHAVFPSFNEYTFDKKKLTLTTHYSLMYPPRRMIEQEFNSKGKPRLVKVLSPKDASSLFPPSKLSVGHYPHCVRESSPSLLKKK